MTMTFKIAGETASPHEYLKGELSPRVSPPPPTLQHHCSTASSIGHSVYVIYAYYNYNEQVTVDRISDIHFLPFILFSESLGSSTGRDDERSIRDPAGLQESSTYPGPASSHS